MQGQLDYLDPNGQLVTMELSKGRTLLGPPPGHAILEWQPSRSTWVVSPARDDVTLAVNGRVVAPGGGVALGHLDVLLVQKLSLRFHKCPAVPVFNGSPCNEVVLSRRKLVIGRDERKGGAPPDPSVDRWSLDFEDLSISKIHAEVSWEEEGFVIQDRSKTGTYLNGSAFERKALVVGDRFSMGDYFFEFTGTSVCRVDFVTGARIEGHGLILDVPHGHAEKRILKGVSIEIKGGEFLGVLGGSGQGKSTLMNVLAGLAEPTKGKVLADGQYLDAKSGRVGGVGFVPQDDIVHHELTVREALTFIARLRLVAPPDAVETLVTGTMRRLGLEAQQHQIIRSLSGGQRKRVNIATELLVRPPVLFLDEPTSGLDPANEESVITALQNLRLTGQTVVCTTHSLHKAYLFDRIAFIHDGRLMFLGTTGEARRHFLEMEEVAIMETVGPFVKLERIYGLFGQQVDAVQWEKKFSESALAPFHPGAPPPPRHVVTSTRLAERPGFIATLRVLMATQWRILRSDPRHSRSLLAQAIIIGLLAGWVGRDDPEFRFFACLIATLWFGCGNAAQMITREFPIFRRERAAGLGLHTYIQSKALFLSFISWGQVLLLLAAQMVPVLIETSRLKIPINSQPSLHLFPDLTGIAWFGLAYVLAAVVGVALGLAISAHSRNTTQATFLVPLILIPQILFSGFVVTLPEMPKTARWFSYIVPSAGAQRLLDTANIDGKPVPLMTEKTEIPMFWRTGFRKDWKHKLELAPEPEALKNDFRELDEYNTSWQNLTVDPVLIGKRLPGREEKKSSGGDQPSKGGETASEPKPASKSAREESYLYHRPDVSLDAKGDSKSPEYIDDLVLDEKDSNAVDATWWAGRQFAARSQTWIGVIVLVGWIAFSYMAAWVGLVLAEPETLRPGWAKRRKQK